MKTIYIASNTSGDENAPQYVSVAMSPRVAKTLLTYRHLAEVANKFDLNFYCIEFFNYQATYGYTDLEVGDEWVEVPEEDSVEQEASKIPCPVIKIKDTGVIWAASFESSSYFFESEELSWKDIEAVANGGNPFPKVKENEDD